MTVRLIPSTVMEPFHMAADEVAAQRGGECQGAFEVDGGAGLKVAEGGKTQGLGGDVSAEPVCAEGGGGEADAVYGDAVARGAAGKIKCLGGDGEGAVVAVAVGGAQGASGFYDACEHGFSGVRVRRRSVPSGVVSVMVYCILADRSVSGGSAASGRASGPSRQGAR